MALNSWLESLKNGVTGVTGVTALIHNDFSGNPTQKSRVTGVTFQSGNPVLVTPVTHENHAGLPKKHNEINEVTPVTPVTRKIIITAVNAANQCLNSECLTQPPETRGQWTWPDGDGWNDAEIAAFLERTERWKPWLGEVQAESLAEGLLVRDRDSSDTRRLCLECRFCIAGRCANSAKAGFVRGNELGALALVLMRCAGYQAGAGSLAAITPTAAAAPASKARLGHPLSDGDRQAAEQYHRHHFGCHQCHAAGRGSEYGVRCDQGSRLWQQYQQQG